MFSVTRNLLRPNLARAFVAAGAGVSYRASLHTLPKLDYPYEVCGFFLMFDLKYLMQ